MWWLITPDTLSKQLFTFWQILLLGSTINLIEPKTRFPKESVWLQRRDFLAQTIRPNNSSQDEILLVFSNSFSVQEQMICKCYCNKSLPYQILCISLYFLTESCAFIFPLELHWTSPFHVWCPCSEISCSSSGPYLIKLKSATWHKEAS